MKIQISDVMKSALHARCGERYIVQERGEIDIYVSLVDLSLILVSCQASVLEAVGDLLCYLIGKFDCFISAVRDAFLEQSILKSHHA